MVAFYQSHTLYATSKHFSLNAKSILRWSSSQTSIAESPRCSRHCKHTRLCDNPRMETALYKEFWELRKKGLKVKGFWFKTRARQLLTKLDPEAAAKFQCSDDWFRRFKDRHSISLRRSTNTAQKPASDKREAVQQFHRTIREVSKVVGESDSHDVGRYKLSQVANMDQTPLPFCFSDGGTYIDKGEKTVGPRWSLWNGEASVYSPVDHL